MLLQIEPNGDWEPVCYCASNSFFFRQAWQLLGNMSQEKAMVEFVSLLTSLCPLFSPYVTAHRVEKEELERRKYVVSIGTLAQYYITIYFIVVMNDRYVQLNHNSLFTSYFLRSYGFRVKELC